MAEIDDARVRAALAAHEAAAARHQRKAKDIQKILDEQADLEKRTADSEKARADAEKATADLRKRMAESREKIARLIQTGAETPQQTLVVRSSRESTIDPQFGRISRPSVVSRGTSEDARTAARILLGSTNPQHTVDTLATVPVALAAAAKDASEELQQDAREVYGLEKVHFDPDRPTVNTDGAVAVPIEISDVGQGRNYEIVTSRLNISSVGGYLMAFACAVDGCGANAPTKRSLDLSDKYFSSEQSLLGHANGSHKADVIEEFGMRTVTVAEFKANDRLCRYTPITATDLALILEGRTPASITRNTGKGQVHGGNEAGLKDILQPKTGRQKRTLEEAQPDNAATSQQGPEKQGTAVFTQSGRRVKTRMEDRYSPAEESEPDHDPYAFVGDDTKGHAGKAYSERNANTPSSMAAARDSEEYDPADVEGVLRGAGVATQRHAGFFRPFAYPGNGAGS